MPKELINKEDVMTERVNEMLQSYINGNKGIVRKWLQEEASLKEAIEFGRLLYILDDNSYFRMLDVL